MDNLNVALGLEQGRLPVGHVAARQQQGGWAQNGDVLIDRRTALRDA